MGANMGAKKRIKVELTFTLEVVAETAVEAEAYAVRVGDCLKVEARELLLPSETCKLDCVEAVEINERETS